MNILKAGDTGTAVRQWQTFLADQAFLPGEADGVFGPLTQQATILFQAAHDLDPDGEVGPQTLTLARQLGFAAATPSLPVHTFDAGSERNIKSLLPKAQVIAREFMQDVLDAGIEIRIISGTRTYAQQNALYAQGRTRPGRIVTNARGGFSNHNFGIAWDIGIFQNGRYIEESSLYDRVGPIGKRMGLEWGGDWVGIVDKPHYQIHTGLTLAQLRNRVAQGISIL